MTQMDSKNILLLMKTIEDEFKPAVDRLRYYQGMWETLRTRINEEIDLK